MQDILDINKTKIALVVNGKSQRGRSLFEQSKELLKQSGVDVDQSFCIRKPSKIRDTVKQLIKDGAGLIILGGGDGTISGAVDYGAFQDVAFGFLPLGTSNSFVRGLNIPLELEQAIEVIKEGKVRSIDMGQIGEDYFANTANLGVSAKVNRSVNNENKKFFGRLAYLPIALWQLLWYKPFNAKITNGADIYEYKCIEILIANGQFQGGLPLALDADLESGNLVVKVFKCQNWSDKWKLMGFWISTLFNLNVHSDNVEILFLDQFTIETNKPIKVDIDGESVAVTPIDVKVAKGSLNVVVGLID
jgi:YegS/Rv2252/BmrU family lipid kinase